MLLAPIFKYQAISFLSSPCVPGDKTNERCSTRITRTLSPFFAGIYISTRAFQYSPCTATLPLSFKSVSATPTSPMIPCSPVLRFSAHAPDYKSKREIKKADTVVTTGTITVHDIRMADSSVSKSITEPSVRLMMAPRPEVRVRLFSAPG